MASKTVGEGPDRWMPRDQANWWAMVCDCKLDFGDEKWLLEVGVEMVRVGGVLVVTNADDGQWRGSDKDTQPTPIQVFGTELQQCPFQVIRHLSKKDHRPATWFSTPPSTAITSPLTYRFLARNKHVCAISSSLPARAAGTGCGLLLILSACSCDFCLSSLSPVVISLGKYPGAIELTRTPVFSNSALISRARCTVAPLAAL